MNSACGFVRCGCHSLETGEDPQPGQIRFLNEQGLPVEEDFDLVVLPPDRASGQATRLGQRKGDDGGSTGG
jgi:hypothetical protein